MYQNIPEHKNVFLINSAKKKIYMGKEFRKRGTLRGAKMLI